MYQFIDAGSCHSRLPAVLSFPFHALLYVPGRYTTLLFSIVHRVRQLGNEHEAGDFAEVN